MGEAFSYMDCRRICQRVREESRKRELLLAENDHHYTEHQECELRKAFEELDRDRNGSLCEEEIRRALELLNMNVEKETALANSFKTLDADRSGNLDFKEFLKLVQRIESKQHHQRNRAAAPK